MNSFYTRVGLEFLNAGVMNFRYESQCLEYTGDSCAL